MGQLRMLSAEAESRAVTRWTARARRARTIDLRCPGCGTLTDAPRINPDTGRRGRKCPSCMLWGAGQGTLRD